MIMFSCMQNISLVLAGLKKKKATYFALCNKMKGNNRSRSRVPLDEVPLFYTELINQLKGI